MANESKLIKDPNETAKNGGNAAKNKSVDSTTAVQQTGGSPQTKAQSGTNSGYDNNTDYQQLINDAVAAGDYVSAAAYEQQRNAKIEGEGLNYEQTQLYADYLPGGSNYVSGVLSGVDSSDVNSIYGAYQSIISQPSQTSDLSDYLENLYAASLEAQQASIEQEYAGIEASLDLQKQQAEDAAQKSATQAAVASQQAQKAWNEAQTAYGLSSGAQGQAALARTNQLQSNITAIRTAEQAALAEIEQQRTTYKQQYEAAIREAAATNDYQRAQALYQEAVRQEEALASQQSQVTQWAMSYLSALGSAAASSSGGSGGGSASGSDGIDMDVISALRTQAMQGDTDGAMGMYALYAAQNPAYFNETVYNAIFGGLEDNTDPPEDQPTGYTGITPTTASHGSTIKGSGWKPQQSMN